MSTMTLKEKIKAKLAASRGGAVSSENQPENDMVSRIKAKLAEQRASEAAQRETEAEEIAPVSTFDTNKSSTGIKRGGVTTDLLAPMRESLAGLDTVKEKQAELDELKATPRYVDDGSGGKKYIGTKAASELDNSIKALESEIEGIKDAAKPTVDLAAKAMSSADFDEYARRGAAIENPTWEEVNKGLSIGGWHPFGADIKNAVTFSRANDANIRFAGNEPFSGVNYLYSRMTADEVKVYNYYLAKEGKDKASEYLATIEDELSKREGSDIAKRYNDNAFLEMSIGAIAGGQGAVQGATTGIKNLLTGSKDTFEYSPLQYADKEVAADNTGALALAHDAASAIGGMLPSVAVGLLNPAAGVAAMGASGAGNKYNEMIEGGSDVNAARGVAVLTGVSEALLQYATGGIGKLGGKGLSKLASKVAPAAAAKITETVAKVAAKSPRILQALGHAAVEMGKEGVEEALQAYLEPLFEAWAEGEEYEAPNFEEVAYSALIGALTSGIFEGAPSVGKAAVETAAEAKSAEVEAVAESSHKKLGVVSSYIQKSKDITQESNVSPSDTNNTTSETHPASLSSDKTSIAQYEAVVKRETEKRIAAAEDESGSKLTSAEKRAIKETVQRDADKGFISVDTIEEALGGETYSKYKKAASSEEKALREYELLADIPANQLSENQRQRLEKLKPRIEDIRAKKKSAALKSRLSDEVAALAKNSRLSESYAERSRRGQVFTADVSKYEGKQREVVQRAIDSGILNNTNRTHEFVDIIARLSADKGVSFDFVNNARLKETGFAVKDATVNGYVDKDGIKINIDSPKAWQSIVGHEVTHVLGETELYAELQSALFDYARKRGDYEKRRDALTKLYESVEGADIDAELTADLVGDYIFTDEAFVRSLSTEHKGVFRRVYDEIKYLVKLVTAGSKEARQLERAKRVFDKVWSESGTAGGVDGAKYSLTGINENGIEVYETSQAVMDLTWTERKAKYLDVMKNEYRGRTAKFVRNGHVYYAEFDQSSIRKPIYGDARSSPNGTKALIKAGADGDVFNLVENSRYRSSRKNIKDHTDADYFDYFVKTVQIDGKVFDLVADVEKKYDGDGGFVYTLALRDNNKIKASPTHGTPKYGAGKNVGNASDTSIPQSSENVNSKFSLSENSTDIGPVVTGGVDGVKYSISPKLSDDLDSVLNGTFNASRSEIYLGETSNFMTGTIGAESLSVTMPASKAYSAMVTEAEYEKNPRYARQDHYHGIGKDDFMEILEKSEDPIAAFAAPPDEDGNDRYNRIVLVTDKKIADVETGGEGYAVVVEEVDTQGRLNNKQIRANKAITVYPRTQIESDIDHAIADGRILAIKQKENQLFAGRRGSKPQATIRKTDLANNIAQFWANVKWKNEKNKINSSSTPVGMTAMQAAFLKAGYNPEGNIQSMRESENDSETKHSLSPADTDIGPVVGFATPTSELRYGAPVAEAVSDMETVQPAADASAEAARPIAHARRISGKQAAPSADIAPVVRQNAATAPVVDTVPSVDTDTLTGGEKAARTKQRSWVKTSTDSESVNGAVSPSDLDAERIHYEPISNKVTIANADKQLNNMGYDNAVTYFNSQFYNRRVSLDDVVLGERLIQQAIARGDTAAASELIENVAILGTELGQKVQALSIIKRNTPEGQLRMLKKVVERGKAKGDKCYDGVEITQAMSDSILDVYDVDGSYDQSELNRVVEQVKQRIADQMSVSTYEKLNAWRYLAMLGNPKTHLRNMLSNVAMTATTVVKDVSARTIESIAPIGNRTKTWARASDEVKAYARATTLAERDIIQGGGKHAEEASIKEKRQIFKNKVLDKVYGLNSEFLTTEDWWFSKYAYRTSLQEFLTANGIRTQADIDANPKLVERGKQYALERAQAATFQQYSWLANKIGEMERKNKALGVAVGAVIPFKKTPINIAKAGLSYSPLGFAKTLTYDIAQVKSGKMEASTLVDHLAQNLTGTALTLAGYLLASAGLINGAGEDDKEGEYDYQLGEQTYSLSIGGQTLSFSWLSPVAMPLFVGANAYEQLVKGEEWNGNVVIETLAQTLDPLSEMSFLSGLNDVLSSYESGGMEKFAGIFESAAQTYVTQYVPTLLSQVAAVTDDTKRTTRAAPDSKFEFFDETINKLKYKIPVLRQTLEPSIDIWGNEIKQEENLALRAFEQFISPSTGKAYIGTEADEELKSLYGRTDDSGVLPTVPKGTVGYDGEDYEMSAEEYTAFRQSYGNAAQELLKKLFDTETYRSISNEEKADMVDRVYDYARDEAKRKLLAGRGVEYTNAGGEDERYYKENPVKGAIEHDMTVDEYVFMTDNPEKYEFLTENGVAYTDYADGSEEFKDAWTWAYKNPDKYTLSRAVADDLVLYRQYARALSDIVSDKDENGESISGSAKAKKAEYISGLDIEYGQKIILYRSLFDSNADRAAYDDDIVEYLINHDGISYEDKVTIFKALGFDVSDDGTVTW